MRPLPVAIPLAALALAACSVDANYTLQIVPRVAPNQEPFADGPEVAIRLLDADGNTEWTPLGALSSGTVEDSGFGPLDATRVGVALGGDDQAPLDIFGWGESPPQTLDVGREEAEVTVLVSRLDGVGALGQLAIPAAGAAAAMTAAGDVYLFGGTSRVAGTCTGDIYKLESLDEGDWSFDLLDFGLGTGVCHATATVVDIDGEERIVVAGGEENLGTSGYTLKTRSITIFDPSTDEVEAVYEPDTAASDWYFSRHHAAPLSDGTILYVGASQRGGVPPNAARWEVFDPSSRRMLDVGAIPLTGDNIGEIRPWGFLASDVEGGVALCGGAYWSGQDLFPVETCLKLNPDGSTTDLPALPLPLRHGAMTTLADGRLLVAGGITDVSQAGGNVAAQGRAFVLELGDSTWSEVGSLGQPRAYHRLVADGVGGAVVIGGVGSGWGYSSTSPEGVHGCGERFVPDGDGGSFVPFEVCGTAATGMLPTVGTGAAGAFVLAGRGENIGGADYGVVSLGPR